MNLNIEKEPYYVEKTYYGEIEIPELTTTYKDNPHLISLAISKTINLNHLQDSQIFYQVRPTIEKEGFIPFRGKDRRLIYDRVMQAIKDQNIIL